MNERTRDLVDAAPGIIAVATLAIVALTAILGFGSLVPIVAVVGWLLLTPLSAILGEVLVPDETDAQPARQSDPEPARDAATDPVDRLRRRYAAGDIDEEEFERRLDLLLDTEGVDAATARERVRQRDRDADAEREADFEFER
ncbi:SHOCT domain-containing protein [Halobaculum litoreum]|uniref:SHOCT domain-containing protein n=1 Tax=Halobaculum litoreum TaxID=3031998 RepID=A0ABD5XKC4_9EURY|nr:SHOCT domain-containing protein [Halobaculum sp. DT92]